MPDEHLADRKDLTRELVASEHLWSGRVIGLEQDQVRLHADSVPIVRQYVTHPGAVAIVALRGQAGSEEVLLINQYRHPVRAVLWEVPAGLLDVAGEDPLAAAQRELREEADMAAREWAVLTDAFLSPGGSSESLRVYLARDLQSTETKFDRFEEEADMEVRWVPLDQATAAVLAGDFHSPTLSLGILAAYTARDRQWQDLRQPDAPWMR